MVKPRTLVGVVIAAAVSAPIFYQLGEDIGMSKTVESLRPYLKKDEVLMSYDETKTIHIFERLAEDIQDWQNREDPAILGSMADLMIDTYRKYSPDMKVQVRDELIAVLDIVVSEYAQRDMNFLPYEKFRRQLDSE